MELLIPSTAWLLAACLAESMSSLFSRRTPRLKSTRASTSQSGNDPLMGRGRLTPYAGIRISRWRQLKNHINMNKTFAFAALFAPIAVCAQPSVRFAVIGDYGKNNQAEADVAALIKSWNPDFIITTGDNNYEFGEEATIDQNVGKYYHEFIFPYNGAYGQGATSNRFFPCLGNHDWLAAGAAPYLNYFTLPGIERYYDFVRGPVHFYAVDSDTNEPDGGTPSSSQGLWLQTQLANSAEPWKIVYFHHPPYNSGAQHGPTYSMRWPFKQWGATAVITGHEHVYERLIEGGLPYFINGLGGKSIHLWAASSDTGSKARYNADYGAMLVEASVDSMIFTFSNTQTSIIDSYTQYNTMTEVQSSRHSHPEGGFHLSQNYPNPFNAVTEIGFQTSDSRFVSLKVYDVVGREIASSLNKTLPAGSYSVYLDVGAFASGIFFYRLEMMVPSARVPSFSEFKKMILLK